MNKESLEKMCRGVGMEPVAKRAIPHGSVLIADGLVSNKGKASLIKRGAFDIGDFPDGVYMTMWFWEDSGHYPVSGAPIFFEKNHDPSWDDATKRSARINRAHMDARRTIEWALGGKTDA